MNSVCVCVCVSVSCVTGDLSRLYPHPTWERHQHGPCAGLRDNFKSILLIYSVLFVVLHLLVVVRKMERTRCSVFSAKLKMKNSRLKHLSVQKHHIPFTLGWIPNSSANSLWNLSNSFPVIQLTNKHTNKLQSHHGSSFPHFSPEFNGALRCSSFTVKRTNSSQQNIFVRGKNVSR